MPETLAELKAADNEFLSSLLQDPILQDALSRQGLDQRFTYPSQHNAVLTLTKHAWTLPYLDGQPKTLNVHFEARRRDQMRMEVGSGTCNRILRRCPFG